MASVRYAAALAGGEPNRRGLLEYTDGVIRRLYSQHLATLEDVDAIEDVNGFPTSPVT